MSDPKPPRRARPSSASGPPGLPSPPSRPRVEAPAPPPAAPPQASELREGARKLIRPSLEAGPPRQRTGGFKRREAPPEATGAEAALMTRLCASAVVVLVRLETGETLRGHLEWVDAGSIKLRRRDEPPVLVMKHAIVSVTAEPARHGG